MAAITKDMTIKEVLDKDINVAPIFFEIGMHCVGCPASSGESIEQAAQVHGYDPNVLLDKLNAYFAE